MAFSTSPIGGQHIRIIGLVSSRQTAPLWDNHKHYTPAHTLYDPLSRCAQTWTGSLFEPSLWVPFLILAIPISSDWSLDEMILPINSHASGSSGLQMESVGIVYSWKVIGVGLMRSGFEGFPGAGGVGMVYSSVECRVVIQDRGSAISAVLNGWQTCCYTLR
jgi:hypothetical protein